jgi:hypothetical protein
MTTIQNVLGKICRHVCRSVVNMDCGNDLT